MGDRLGLPCAAVAIFSFFTFQKYLLINLCFSMLSYSGVWRLYMFFYEQYPHMHKKLEARSRVELD